ncbi:MAG: phosphomannomutase/phosphoglucomutase [Lachnospiraceae bacterium]|jgi:phosphomannomutase
MAISKNELLALQNGSDIRGVALQLEGGSPVTLTDEAAYLIGRAFVRWLSGSCGITPEKCTVGIGADCRVTGSMLKAGLIKGIISEGASVCDCALATTPAMFMSVIYPETSFTASCMLTASHLPSDRNGIKCFNKNGGLNKGDITEILNIAADIAEGGYDIPGEMPDIPKFDLLSAYASDLKNHISDSLGASEKEKPLSGLKIVVDAGNGMGGFFADILSDLGADTKGSRYLDPDGTFPNHIPNPEDPTAMHAICEAVKENTADLGLIFDTDVDRMSAVLSGGRPLNRDAIIAMMSAILSKDYPGSTIITDSVTSDRLTAFLEEKLGLKHLCFKRGYKNVINKCIELNEQGIVSPLAMETSGHGCLKDNYYLDDGAMLAVKLVSALADAKSRGLTIDSLIDGFSTEFCDREIRFKISGNDFKEYMADVIDKFKEKAENAGYLMPNSFEGIRIKFTENPCGWMLLRASLHDPVMVLNLEGITSEDLKAISEIAADLLSGFDRLDISAL